MAHPAQAVTRRTFVGGVAAAVAYLGLDPATRLEAERFGLLAQEPNDYDGMAKLGNNENPWGPPESVMKAMMKAFKYANRYGYPDGDVTEKIAAHHGVKPENILLGAGSGEILKVVGVTFLRDGRKVLGVEPSYGQVYSHATSIRADAVLIPLLPDYDQDIDAMIKAAKVCCHEVGFVYVCNPNNPTGKVIAKEKVRRLLDAIPEDMPVLIDEAYHHFVEDPSYETAVPYIAEGRNVIVARTFSKISGLAGMRLGYAVASPELVRMMRPHSTGSINAVVKWGAVAALEDTAAQERVKSETIAQRKKTVAELAALGYQSIPSEASFFMLHIRRPVQPVIEEFRKRGVIVGRPFPPMTEHLRVSIGTPEEMARFMAAFKQIFAITSASTGSGG